MTIDLANCVLVQLKNRYVQGRDLEVGVVNMRKCKLGRSNGIAQSRDAHGKNKCEAWFG